MDISKHIQQNQITRAQFLLAVGSVFLAAVTVPWGIYRQISVTSSELLPVRYGLGLYNNRTFDHV